MLRCSTILPLTECLLEEISSAQVFHELRVQRGAPNISPMLTAQMGISLEKNNLKAWHCVVKEISVCWIPASAVARVGSYKMSEPEDYKK